MAHSGVGQLRCKRVCFLSVSSFYAVKQPDIREYQPDHYEDRKWELSKLQSLLLII